MKSLEGIANLDRDPEDFRRRLSLVRGPEDVRRRLSLDRDPEDVRRRPGGLRGDQHGGRARAGFFARAGQRAGAVRGLPGGLRAARRVHHPAP